MNVRVREQQLVLTAARAAVRTASACTHTFFVYTCILNNFILAQNCLYFFPVNRYLLSRTQAILRQEIGFFDVTKTGRNSQKSAHCDFIQSKCFRF
jgi:hypothetical protein